MLFKDLKVGDIIYCKNPNQWNKPIKKTIGKIIPDVIWIVFYTADGELIGAPRAKCSQDSRLGIFADFDAFKKYWTDYHTKRVERLQDEKQKVVEALASAVYDLATATHMEEED